MKEILYVLTKCKCFANQKSFISINGRIFSFMFKLNNRTSVNDETQKIILYWKCQRFFWNLNLRSRLRPLVSYLYYTLHFYLFHFNVSTLNFKLTTVLTSVENCDKVKDKIWNFILYSKPQAVCKIDSMLYENLVLEFCAIIFKVVIINEDIRLKTTLRSTRVY